MKLSHSHLFGLTGGEVVTGTYFIQIGVCCGRNNTEMSGVKDRTRGFKAFMTV